MSDEYIKKDDAIKAVNDMPYDTFFVEADRMWLIAEIDKLPSADVVERAKCDSCEVRNDSYIEAVSATGYDHGFEDGYSKGRAERKRGEWIDNTSETWTPSKKCSECGLVVHSVATDSIDFHAKTKMNFCPNCGADMRGDGNDD